MRAHKCDRKVSCHKQINQQTHTQTESKQDAQTGRRQTDKHFHGTRICGRWLAAAIIQNERSGKSSEGEKCTKQLFDHQKEGKLRCR